MFHTSTHEAHLNKETIMQTIVGVQNSNGATKQSTDDNNKATQPHVKPVKHHPYVTLIRANETKSAFAILGNVRTTNEGHDKTEYIPQLSDRLDTR